MRNVSGEMTRDLRVLAVTSCGGFFLQGEPQEKAYRESLSEASGVLKALVIKVWAERLERKLRDYYGLIRSTKSGTARKLCIYTQCATYELFELQGFIASSLPKGQKLQQPRATPWVRRWPKYCCLKGNNSKKSHIASYF